MTPEMYVTSVVAAGVLGAIAVLLVLACLGNVMDSVWQWWGDVRVLWLQLRLTYTKWRLDRATATLSEALTQGMQQARRDMRDAAIRTQGR